MTDVEKNLVPRHGNENKDLDATQPIDIADLPRPRETAVAAVHEEKIISFPTPERRKSASRVKAIAGIAGIAVVAASAGGVIVFNALRGQSGSGGVDLDKDNGDKQTSQTPAAETAAPSATPETTSSTESLAIPAGLSDEEFGKEVTDRLTAWTTGGATPELYKKWLNGGTNSEQIVADAANTNSMAVADALFGADWHGKPALEALYAKFNQLNLADLDQYVHTFNKDVFPDDTQPYRSYSTYDSVEKMSTVKNGRNVQVTGTEHNNSALNRVGEPGSKLYSAAEVGYDGTQFTYQYWTRIVTDSDGSEHEVIANWANATGLNASK